MYFLNHRLVFIPISLRLVHTTRSFLHMGDLLLTSPAIAYLRDYRCKGDVIAIPPRYTDLTRTVCVRSFEQAFGGGGGDDDSDMTVDAKIPCTTSKVTPTGTTAEYRMTHTNPQCYACCREIEGLGSRNLLTGFYTKYHCYMHYACYNEMEQKLLSRLLEKEDTIIEEVTAAMETGKVESYRYYNRFQQGSFHPCQYCGGFLTDVYVGVCYPSLADPHKYLFIHTSCYNDIRVKSRYTPAIKIPIRMLGTTNDYPIDSKEYEMERQEASETYRKELREQLDTILLNRRKTD